MTEIHLQMLTICKVQGREGLTSAPRFCIPWFAEYPRPPWEPVVAADPGVEGDYWGPQTGICVGF